MILAVMTVMLSVTGCSGQSPVSITFSISGKTAGTTEQIPSLKEALTSENALGAGTIVGACISSVTIKDPLYDDLIRKHYNAVTLENELKPDAMFGYNNDAPPKGSIHEETLNGKPISVPTLDPSRADAILDEILAWNKEMPEDPIRVRGHVLVWHSQTPEWFFHKDYDQNSDYVSKEEMDRRLEWYIKSVLEYYTAPGSRYSGLFYAWDVVNEAVSDRTGSYRSDTEDSNWWKIYESNEYIINAFRYANLYAPEDLDLYYNDYNECDKKKSKGILTLISDVRSAEGTRITGFGMQGHYAVFAPTDEMIETAARQYASAVDKIMITELDVKPSMFYDGTKDALTKEYERQADYYGKIYDVLYELKREGRDIAGVSFWGVVDSYSWLNDRSSNAAPLLFDDDHNPKPAFYAFIEHAQNSKTAAP